MKYLMMFICILLLVAGCAPKPAAQPTQPVSDDLAVYRAVLAYYGYQHPVVRENTSYRGMSTVEELLPFLENKIAADTAANYLKAVAQPAPLAALLGSEKNLSILTEKESDEIFTNHPSEGFDEFSRRFPNQDSGILSLSAVGYNAAHTEALVEAGAQKGFKAGLGEYLILKKVNGEWQVSIKKVVWKS